MRDIKQYVENLRFDPLDPHEPGVVALTIHYKDPNTGREWRQYHPRIRVEDRGVTESGQHEYTFTRDLGPDVQDFVHKEAP